VLGKELFEKVFVVFGQHVVCCYVFILSNLHALASVAHQLSGAGVPVAYCQLVQKAVKAVFVIEV